MSTKPVTNARAVAVGDHIGRTPAITCHDRKMAWEDFDGHREYTCVRLACETVIEIDQQGTVFDTRP